MAKWQIITYSKVQIFFQQDFIFSQGEEHPFSLKNYIS